MLKTVASRDFNQNASRIRRSANKGPIFITEHGKLTHVLLSIDDYNYLSEKKVRADNLIDALSLPDKIDIQIDFTSPKLDSSSFKPPEFD